MERTICFDKNVIVSMVRETLDDPGGRTYVVLIYYDTEYSQSGFVVTPVLKYDNKYLFTKNAELSLIMKIVIQEYDKEGIKHRSKTFLRWLKKRNKLQAAWAIHYWERPDGDLEGRAYSVLEHRETVFYGTANLEKILSTFRGEKDSEKKGNQ